MRNKFPELFVLLACWLAETLTVKLDKLLCLIASSLSLSQANDNLISGISADFVQSMSGKSS